jgi:hypothetical protein
MNYKYYYDDQRERGEEVEMKIAAGRRIRIFRCLKKRRK